MPTDKHTKVKFLQRALAKGYRWVRFGETLRKTDEFSWTVGGEWVFTTRVGHRCHAAKFYRRKVSKK